MCPPVDPGELLVPPKTVVGNIRPMRVTAVVPFVLLVVTACVQLLGDDFEVADDEEEEGGGGIASTSEGGGGAAGGAAGGGGDGTGGAPPCIEGFDGVVTQCIAQRSQALVLGAEEAGVANLTIEIYYGFGDPPPPPTGIPFTFEFYGENYATCGVCARMFDQCDGGSCARQFIPISGHLEVVSHGAVGDPFTGVLTNVVFAEATIDQATFQSTLVANGATRCVASFAFDAVVSP
jgi:hypothetical protein